MSDFIPVVISDIHSRWNKLIKARRLARILNGETR